MLCMHVHAPAWVSRGVEINRGEIRKNVGEVELLGAAFSSRALLDTVQE